MAEEAAATVAQLETARKHVLADANHYTLVIPGVLPLIGAKAHLNARRWGADFLAESFASPALPAQAKEVLCIQILPLVHELLESAGQDEAVVKSIIQAAASIYGPVFRYVTNHPEKTDTWAWMSAVKANILRRLDTDTIGARICCIKFVQRVIQVQTPGAVPDPRRPEQNEISIAAVPRDHPLIPPPRLEPEASGLLDRLLSVLYENSVDALLVDATLSGFAILARTRPSIAHKIISAAINFNPLQNAHSTMSPKERVTIQSMERTTSHFLLNYNKRHLSGPLASRITARVKQLYQQRLEVFKEFNKKRGPPAGPTDGLDSVKRARLGANGRANYPPLPPGPASVAQLYTLTDDAALQSFDVSPIPIDLVVKVTLPVLQRIDVNQLDDAINAIRTRYLSLSRQPSQPIPSTQTKLDVEDDDDYEPEFEPTEDNEQIMNKLDTLTSQDRPHDNLALGPFKLAQPPPLTTDEAEQLGKGSITRTLSMMNRLEEPSKTPKPGLNRLAGSGYDRDAWVTVITRLATRACAPEYLDRENEGESNKKALTIGTEDRSLGSAIRETLWKYVIEDFRHRIDIAIAWLNEEWYNDIISQSECMARESTSPMSKKRIEKPNYEKWVLKVLDAIVPYLDANDKVLIRFLGEIPEVSNSVLDRVKNMTRDPDRVKLAVRAIYYLVAFKPPSKEAAIDALRDLWENYPDAKASAREMLARVRPSLLEESGPNRVKKESPGAPTASDDIKTKTEPAPVAAAG